MKKRPGPEFDPKCAGIGLYVHIPFCFRKCHYCDFNSGPAGPALRQRYLTALAREIETSPWKSYRAFTLFLGGGTPSELSSRELGDLIERIQNSFQMSEDAECTIECNPGTVDGAAFRMMRRLGLNRVSLGIQSFNNRYLHSLGRIHTAEDARQAYRDARSEGFQNVSIDLIFSLQEQKLSQWENDLNRALELEPEHLSIYHLTIEPGTDFWNRRKHLNLPDEETGAQMYELAIDLCEQAGYEQYEISNFARAGFRSRHNSLYWANRPYLGFGVGAASYYAGIRWSNTANWSRYIESSSQINIPFSSYEQLAGEEAMAEEIMLRLRTREGFSPSHLSQNYRLDVWSIFQEPIQLFTRHGLLAHDRDTIRLTRRGLLLANEVCGEFLRAVHS